MILILIVSSYKNKQHYRWIDPLSSTTRRLESQRTHNYNNSHEKAPV